MQHPMDEALSQHDSSTTPVPPTANNEHIPVANNAIGTKGQRRRPSGAPGSRGVANLSAEQLAKKRANDREAQRAIRERTRNTIEALERRIRELEGQQPFQELQRVVVERDRALAECEELRRRLGAVAGIVGAQSPTGPGSGQGLAPPGLNELAAYTAQQSPLPPRGQQPSQSPVPPFEQHHVHPDLRSSHSERTSVNNSPSFHHRQAGEPHRASPTQVQHSNQGRLDVDFLLEQRPVSATPSNQSFHSPRPPEQPLYERLTNVGPPSCPLDFLLVDFVKRRRELLRNGMPAYEVLGPDYPDFTAMLNPGSLSQCHPVSAFFIDVLEKFPDVRRLPEKIAVFYAMFLVLRWLVCPCQAYYERLPEWCRPVSEQFEIPHVAYADYLPWPHMRRQLVLNEREVNFGDFFVPYCATLSLNWSLPDDRVLLTAQSSHSEDRPNLVMSSEFEGHMRNLDNWSLGTVFRNTFPHLIDLQTMRIRDP